MISYQRKEVFIHYEQVVSGRRVVTRKEVSQEADSRQEKPHVICFSAVPDLRASLSVAILVKYK